VNFMRYFKVKDSKEAKFYELLDLADLNQYDKFCSGQVYCFRRKVNHEFQYCYIDSEKEFYAEFHNAGLEKYRFKKYETFDGLCKRGLIEEIFLTPAHDAKILPKPPAAHAAAAVSSPSSEVHPYAAPAKQPAQITYFTANNVDALRPRTKLIKGQVKFDQSKEYYYHPAGAADNFYKVIQNKTEFDQVKIKRHRIWEVNDGESIKQLQRDGIIIESEATEIKQPTENTRLLPGGRQSDAAAAAAVGFHAQNKKGGANSNAGAPPQANCPLCCVIL
jgi:hypothetical protein